MLVVVLIAAVLLTLLAPALSSTLGAARGFRCQMSLRQISFDFSLFADDQMYSDRGDDERRTDDRFRLMTFQESQYGLDEYWAYGDSQTAALSEDVPDPPMRCTEVHGDLMLARDLSAESWGAIAPSERVSYGFNIRLHRPEINYGDFQAPTLEPARLDSKVLMESMTPLVWDVDGAEAFRQKGVLPQFTGPSLGSRGLYANEMVWFPGMRHNGNVNVAFIGGQVVSTSNPLGERGWRWDFQPSP